MIILQEKSWACLLRDEGETGIESRLFCVKVC